MKTKFLLVYAFLVTTACNKTYNPFTDDPSAADFSYNRPVGASARDLLSAATYTGITLELQYMQGYPPDAAALDHARNMVNELVHKPAGVEIVLKEIPAAASNSLTIEQVLEIERKNRTVFTTGNRLGLYLLYTNGSYSDDKVLGAAYRNSSMVLFGKKIADNSGGLNKPSRTKLEATVLEHEIGHLLGLVDVGTKMQTNHKDAAHGNHCNNQNCLMYYTAETTDLLGLLVTGNIPALDANCRADLTANGGK